MKRKFIGYIAVYRHVSRWLSVAQDGQQVYIMMELCEGGDLLQFLKASYVSKSCSLNMRKAL